MASENEACVTKMKRILEVLVEAHRLKSAECDKVIYQSGQFLDYCSVESDFEHFDPSKSTSRVYKLFYEHMAGNKQPVQVWSVVKLLLLMSHGQATVGRGFSVNKEVAVENLKERSFIAQRIIRDHIESVGGLPNVQISKKKLLMSSAGAQQKYLSHLEEQRRMKVSQEKILKRKSTMQEIDLLKKKKRQFETDVKALLKSADEFADRAEDSRKFKKLLNQTVYKEKDGSLERH